MSLRETGDERRAVALAHADRARGIEPVPLDEVLREFDATRDSPNAITTEPINRAAHSVQCEFAGPP